VSVEDYSPFLSELSMFRVYVHATVDETDQLTATFADFRLILPQLDIIVSYLLIHVDFIATCSTLCPFSCMSRACHYLDDEVVGGLTPKCDTHFSHDKCNL